jgi:hypothetical protein
MSIHSISTVSRCTVKLASFLCARDGQQHACANNALAVSMIDRRGVLLRQGKASQKHGLDGSHAALYYTCVTVSTAKNHIFTILVHVCSCQ